MDTPETTKIGDRLNRLVKLAVDTGEAATIEEAEKIFGGYKLAVVAGASARHSSTQQATLLTIVNAGRRSFLGGVEVEGIVDMPLLVPLNPYRTLEEAVAGLGGKVVKAVRRDVPLIAVGDVAASRIRHPLALQTTFDGWAGGFVPLESQGGRLSESQEFVSSGVAAGALAVAEAFQYLRGSAVAGRRHVGLSLWRPELNWQSAEAIGPVIHRLPSALWLIGLGNLGQAYVWTLGLLPYASPAELQLVLQDVDVIAESNDSTSLLTGLELVGERKTRAMASWAEKRGFTTAIVERRFGPHCRVGGDDPAVALCGVDNGLARRALEDAGFGRVIEAGLGKGTGDYLGFRTHVFPGERKARDIWRTDEVGRGAPIDLPAYQSLAATGADQCGLTQLAGRTVGAPFVGAIAAAVVVGEVLRLVNGGHGYDLIDGHLKSLDHRTVVPAGTGQPFNPGSTESLCVGENLRSRAVKLEPHVGASTSGLKGVPVHQELPQAIVERLAAGESTT